MVFIEKKQGDYKTINQVVKAPNTKYGCVALTINEKGFYFSQSDRTYLPENVCRVEVVDSASASGGLIYLLEMTDGLRGWVEDGYGLQANDELANHLQRIKSNVIITD